MNKISIYTLIKNSLPEKDWTLVIGSLKRDSLIWKSVLDATSIEKLDGQLNNREDWYPVNLGLKLIGHKSSLKELQNSDLPALEDPQFTKAMNLLDAVFSGNSIHDLEEATLISLGIRDKVLLGDSRLLSQKGITQKNIGSLYSIFACLYGLTDQRNNILEECMFFDSSYENQLLLLHAILCNPSGIHQQVNTITSLLLKRPPNSLLSALDIYKFIQHLKLTNPTVAAHVSKNVLDHLRPTSNNHAYHNAIISKLYNLEYQLLCAELQNSSRNDVPQRELSSKYLGMALNELVDLWFELSPRIQNFNSTGELPQDIEDEIPHIKNRDILEEMFSNRFTTESPQFQEKSLLTFFENEQYLEAENFIKANDLTIKSGFLNHLTLAVSAFQSGDQDLSTIHARNAIAEINGNEAILVNYLPDHTESVINPFLRLLIDIDLPQESVSIARKALNYRELDFGIQSLLGEALVANFAFDEAAEAYYIAVLQKPGSLDIRRKLALCLEKIGKWPEAYDERKFICSETAKDDTDPEIDDLQKFADCAINLGSIEEAIQLCEEAILQDAGNGYSHSLLGKALLGKNDHERAIEEFEKGIQSSPHIPGTWLLLADARNNSGNVSAAIETLHAAFQTNPTSADIQLALGEMYLSQKALTEALSSFYQGVELEPKNIQIQLMLGTTLQLLGHLAESKQILEKAYAKAPNHVGVANVLANTLLQLGEKTKAIPILYVVIKSNPQSINPYLDFAEAVMASRSDSEDQYSVDEVVFVINKALELDPTNPIAHALLGEALSEKENFTEAKKAFQVALESNIVEKEEWFTRLSLGMGRVALALGQDDVALASIQEALQVDPNNPEIHKALCEIYQAVNLPENALQSARTALSIAIDDIDTLIWFADQMLVISEMESLNYTQPLSSDLLNQIQSEALNALSQANQIAPYRADLLVRLGRIQSILGERANAITTLNRLIDNEHSNIDDLTLAGELLSELGEICGAIACLNRATNQVLDLSNETSSKLLIDLARLYQIDGDNDAAIRTLNKALENNPSFGPVYYAKANLLLDLNNDDEAFSCIIDGLDKAKDKESEIHLHLLAGKVVRRRGDLATALRHAEEGLSICTENSKYLELNEMDFIQTITFTTELFEAILKPNRGRLLIKDMERKFKIDVIEDLDYCCTYVELFIDVLDNEVLTSTISRMIERYPNHPRVLALQARIFNRRRDYHTSLQILHAALEAANVKISDSKVGEKPVARNAVIANWYTLCDSALELFQWDTVQYIVHQILDIAPQEPRAHLNQVKLLVMRAEYQRLCEKTDLKLNSPGIAALSEESRAFFEQAISDTVRFLHSSETDQLLRESNSDIGKINPIINRWRARGLAIFGNNEEISNAIEELTKLNDYPEISHSQIYADDISALIAAELRLAIIDDNEKLTKLANVARNDLENLQLPLHAALALAITQPHKAISLLMELNAAFHSKGNPLIAMGNALRAKLLNQINEYESAKSAIDDALAVYNNEPNWHTLAANIYQNLYNVVESIHHYDEAIRLEPNNLENHIGLGKLLLDNAEFDLSHVKRAIQVLERACRIEPESPEPWYHLSRASLTLSDFDQAASYAEMALTIAPDDKDLLILRGEIALHQKNPKIALDFVNEVLENNKLETQAIIIKSQALHDLGQANQALELLGIAMESIKDPLTLQLEYAKLLYEVHGPRASIDSLNHLVEQYPDDPKLLSLLAKNMADIGQTEIAIKTAQRALQVSNGNQPVINKAELHFLVGSLLIRTRQLDQAIYHLSESIALTPNYVDPYLELGRAQQERRQYREALEVFQKATRIAPNDPRPHYQAGLALKEAKDYKTSETLLRKAADLAPGEVNIRRQLAAVVALNLVHNPYSKRIVEE